MDSYDSSGLINAYLVRGNGPRGVGGAGVDTLAIALAFPNSPIEAPRLGRTFMTVDAAGTEQLAAAARRSVRVDAEGAAYQRGRDGWRTKQFTSSSNGVPSLC